MCVCQCKPCTNTRSPRTAEVSASVEAETDASECGFSRCEEGASPCDDGPESPADLAPEAARSLCLEAPHLAGRQGNCPAANASEVRLTGRRGQSRRRRAPPAAGVWQRGKRP